MIELEPAHIRARLPRQWHRIDLKKLLGPYKSQADDLIRTWSEAGHLESVPGKAAFYRWTSSAPAASTADEQAVSHSNLASIRARLQAAYRHLHAAPQWVARLRHLRRDDMAQWLEQWREQVRSGEWRAGLDPARLRAWFASHPIQAVLIGLALLLPLLAVVALSGSTSREPEPAATAPTRILPTLPDAIVAWYAPGQNSEVFGALDSGTPYETVARYGDGWVQLTFADAGPLWVRAADMPGVDLASLPDLMPPIVGYSAHTVAPGETLDTIAALGGSNAWLIGSYNRLNGAPPPGRVLIVPHLEGQHNTLTPAPLLMKQGNTALPRVALTIDLEMGDEVVVQLLNVLRERNTHITFFVLGSWVEQHPDLARQIVQDGHELASHSLAHADYRTLNDDQIAHDLAETERIIAETTGASARPYFRPPYGGYDDRVLQTVTGQGYLTIHWSNDSRDSVGEPKSPEFLVEQITSVANPVDLYGDIILVHCCSPRHHIAEALPTILDRFAEQQVQVGTVSEVLE